MSDTMTVNGPGDTAPGEVAISAVYENYDDDLVTQETTLPSPEIVATLLLVRTASTSMTTLSLFLPVIFPIRRSNF